MTHATALRHVAFVLRCAGAAALAYHLAADLGLGYPAWASISALIVSQERLTETKSAMIGRFAGTLTGIAIAILVGSALERARMDISVQMAAAVGLCAALARRFPVLRAAMWTAPIVFLSGTPLVDAGLWRGVEVILGGLVGAALHLAAEALLLPLIRPGAPPPADAPVAPIVSE